MYYIVAIYSYLPASSSGSGCVEFKLSQRGGDLGEPIVRWKVLDYARLLAPKRGLVVCEMA